MKNKFFKKFLIFTFSLIICISSTTAYVSAFDTSNTDTIDTVVHPMWQYIYQFDHYDANYHQTDNTAYKLGEFTCINYSYTQPMDANYSQTESATLGASYTVAVSANAEYKAAVVNVGTSITASGTVSLTVSSGFTYNTGSVVSPRKQATITLYNKGVAVTGCKVYRMYDPDYSYLGLEYRPDTADCWFPKLNAKSATLSPEIPIQ